MERAQMRRAIVMAGGQGSRLQPLTLARPKPLVRVANRPVMTYLLEWLGKHGFAEVLVTLHYRGDDIRRAFRDGRDLGLNITYRVEEHPLGTAGSVQAAEDWIGHEPFLVASGDALTDVHLTSLLRRHRETGSWLTLGLKRVADPSEYGVVELDDQKRVTRFQEKPGPGRAFSSLANTGIYCVEPTVLPYLPRGLRDSVARNPSRTKRRPSAQRAGLFFVAIHCSGRRQDVTHTWRQVTGSTKCPWR